MGFLDRLIRNRERARLEEAVRKEPTPAAFLGLAHVLQEEGDPAQARQVAKRGLAAFPKDAELARFEHDLGALERDAESTRLREQIANYPNGRLYARLAEIYRAGGQSDKALQVARSGLAGFPNHDGLHYVMGLLRADDGASEEACRHLSRAAELNGFNYSALKLLGQLLVSLGRHAEAAETFGRIRGFAPDDEEVKELHSRAAQAAGVSANPIQPGPTAKPAAGGQEVPATTAVAAITAAPATLRPETPAAAGGDSLLAIALSRLVGKDGIDGAILADSAGRTVAAAPPPGQAEEAMAAAVADLRRATSPVCGEMGLGGFEDAFVETVDGGLHLFAIRDMTLGICAAPRSRAGLIALHARAFARKVQGGNSEEAGP